MHMHAYVSHGVGRCRKIYKVYKVARYIYCRYLGKVERGVIAPIATADSVAPIGVKDPAEEERGGDHVVHEEVDHDAAGAQVVLAQAHLLRLQLVELLIHVVVVVLALLRRQLARQCLTRAVVLREAGRGEVVEAERQRELFLRQLAVFVAVEPDPELLVRAAEAREDLLVDLLELHLGDVAVVIRVELRHELLVG